MRTVWNKTFLCTFEAYFLMKVQENWMHDYWNENTSNDIFHFSVSAIELMFQSIDFLMHQFLDKSDEKMVREKTYWLKLEFYNADKKISLDVFSFQ